jgi:predicted transcriptional regulator of viral defense system
VRIEFHVSNLVQSAATKNIQTETGSMLVSTPETTALDLVRFPAACGQWDNIATVVRELAEKLDADKLVAGAARVARSDVQRLGWLLDLLDETELADALERALEGQRLLPTPLTSARDSSDVLRDDRWQILVNDDVEPDL